MFYTDSDTKIELCNSIENLFWYGEFFEKNKKHHYIMLGGKI